MITRLKFPFCLLASLTLLAAFGEAAQIAPAGQISHGGTILMVGDSIFDCHEGDKRIEAVMQHVLERKAPGARWTIYNEAYGGEYIGPKEGSPLGVSTPLFTTTTSGRIFDIVGRHPHADAVLINYAANDSKVYPPATFRRRLEALTQLLEKEYPGAVIVICTSMYLDPNHSAPYRYEFPQVAGFKNGSSRNEYLEPYNREIREFTSARGYRLADTYRRLVAETRQGNWDLRIRADEGDPADDSKHVGDMRWFDNIHPNDRGTEIIAEGLVEALLRIP